MSCPKKSAGRFSTRALLWFIGSCPSLTPALIAVRADSMEAESLPRWRARLGMAGMEGDLFPAGTGKPANQSNRQDQQTSGSRPHTRSGAVFRLQLHGHARVFDESNGFNRHGPLPTVPKADQEPVCALPVTSIRACTVIV